MDGRDPFDLIDRVKGGRILRRQGHGQDDPAVIVGKELAADALGNDLRRDPAAGNTCQGSHIGHVLHFLQLPDQHGFRRLAAGRHHQDHAVGKTEYFLDFRFLGQDNTVLPEGMRASVIIAVLRMQPDGRKYQRHKKDGSRDPYLHHRPGDPGSAADQRPVGCSVNQPPELHDCAGQQGKGSQQAEQDAFGQNNAQIKTDPVFHKSQGHKADHRRHGTGQDRAS